jgi:hypothetical protein
VVRGAYALDPRVTAPSTELVVHLAPAAGGATDVVTQSLGAGGVSSPLTWGLAAATVAGSLLLERRRRRKA